MTNGNKRADEFLNRLLKLYQPLKKKTQGLPWWFRVKRLNIGDTGSIPDPGKSHMLQSN